MQPKRQDLANALIALKAIIQDLESKGVPDKDIHELRVTYLVTEAMARNRAVVEKALEKKKKKSHKEERKRRRNG